MQYGFADKRHVQLPEMDAELELQEAKSAGRAGSLQCRYFVFTGTFLFLRLKSILTSQDFCKAPLQIGKSSLIGDLL